jgi:hypothetical protein
MPCAGCGKSRQSIPDSPPPEPYLRFEFSPSLRLCFYPCSRDRQHERCSLSPARNAAGTSRPVSASFRSSRLSSSARYAGKSAAICRRKYSSDGSISWSIVRRARGLRDVRPRRSPATNQSRDDLSGRLPDCRNPARPGAAGERAGGTHKTSDRRISRSGPGSL